MANINDRFFGTPLSGNVRVELERRQREIGEIEFGDSIEVGGTTTEGSKLNQYNEVHSRTPFVRMWTSLKLIQPYELQSSVYGETYTEEELEAAGGAEKVLSKYNTEKEVNNFGSAYTTSELIKRQDGTYVVKKNNQRDQADFARKIYVIGNHEYQNSYGEVSINQSIENNEIQFLQDDKSNTDNFNTLGDILPQELRENRFLKPQSGITALSVETMGTLGEIKQTRVNFVVHNFRDFDMIFEKYFLKPGATIFVDYGWSVVKNLYHPSELIDSIQTPGGIESFLYDENTGVITKNEENFDVIQGLVQDYNAKVLPNGSVECEVTLISSNSTILDKKPESSFSDRMISVLKKGVFFHTVTHYIKDLLENFEDKNSEEYQKLLKELIEFLSTPGLSSNTNAEEYEKKLKQKALLTFSSNDLPSKSAVEQGIFIPQISEGTDVYLSWGVIEDLILNPHFGHGKDESTTNQGKNFEVRFDSSNSFTKYNSTKAENQIREIANKEYPKWIYPKWWHDGGGDNGLGVDAASKVDKYTSYSFKKGKTPERNHGISINENSTHYDDILNSRIPIREIFVNVSLLIEQFEKAKDNITIKKIVKNILKELNDDDANLFEWDIKAGSTDSKIEICDKKYFGNYIIDNKEQESDLFTFNIMSKNSIVKDYNLEMKLPSGDIGSEYALRGLSHDSSVNKIKKDYVPKLIEAYQMHGVEDLSIIYEPDMGDFNANQNILNDDDSEVFNVYDEIRRQTMGGDLTEIYNEITNDSGTQKQQSTSGPDADADTKVSEVNLYQIAKENERVERLANKSHSQSIRGYFDYQLFLKETQSDDSVYFPYYLTLTIYGIASIQPGDIFKVDFLPTEHLKNSFLQTMRVIHNIGTDGWYTTLETQYRNAPTRNNENTSTTANNNALPTVNTSDIRLSPLALKGRLKPGMYYPSGGFHKDYFYGNPHFGRSIPRSLAVSFQPSYLLAFMTNIQVKGGGFIETLKIESKTKTLMKTRKIAGYRITFTTPAASDNDNTKFKYAELNKIKGIFLQPLYAEFAYKNDEDKNSKFYKPIKWDKFLYEKADYDLANSDYAKKLRNNLEGFASGIFGGPNANETLSPNPHGEKIFEFNGVKISRGHSQYAPFSFTDIKYYNQNINQLNSEGRPKTYGSSAYNEMDKDKKTRVYPPSCKFVPNEEYEMVYLLDSQQWAVFRKSIFSEGDINKMIQYFVTIGTNVKESKSN